jgi:histidinol dehydrogenase
MLPKRHARKGQHRARLELHVRDRRLFENLPTWLLFIGGRRRSCLCDKSIGTNHILPTDALVTGDCGLANF